MASRKTKKLVSTVKARSYGFALNRLSASNVVGNKWGGGKPYGKHRKAIAGDMRAARSISKSRYPVKGIRSVDYAR